MSEALATADSGALVEQVVVHGDLAKLTAGDRVRYYRAVCDSVGLNPLTKPLEYITLNGKLTLYARRDATDQLRRLRGVSISITAREKVDELYIVTAKAVDQTGRVDESVGAVTLQGLRGENLANAIMKAETKAKRRVTLSICGLGLLDETEVETIPAVAKATVVDKETGEVLDASDGGDGSPGQRRPPLGPAGAGGVLPGRDQPDPITADLDAIVAKLDAETDLKAGAALFKTVTTSDFWDQLTTSQQRQIIKAKDAMKERIGGAA